MIKYSDITRTVSKSTCIIELMYCNLKLGDMIGSECIASWRARGNIIQVFGRRSITSPRNRFRETDSIHDAVAAARSTPNSQLQLQLQHQLQLNEIVIYTAAVESSNRRIVVSSYLRIVEWNWFQVAPWEIASGSLFYDLIGWRRVSGGRLVRALPPT